MNAGSSLSIFFFLRYVILKEIFEREMQSEMQLWEFIYLSCNTWECAILVIFINFIMLRFEEQNLSKEIFFKC